jgi:hypothetical protein
MWTLCGFVDEIGDDVAGVYESARPARPSILIPYVSLFFGSIVAMGIPMYSLNRGLWLVTVLTSVTLLISMTVAIRRGAA